MIRRRGRCDVGGDLHVLANGGSPAATPDHLHRLRGGGDRSEIPSTRVGPIREELHRRIRAYNPSPGAFFFTASGDDSVRIKVWASSLEPAISGQPGTFLQYDANGIVVACGEGALRLDTLQAPGKRRVPAHEFVTQIDLR